MSERAVLVGDGRKVQTGKWMERIWFKIEYWKVGVVVYTQWLEKIKEGKAELKRKWENTEASRHHQ
jgi:hypothetical protein